MKNLYLLLKSVLILFFFSVLTQHLQAQVSGKVFRDFNANGIQTTAAPDPIEPGLKDVTVNAYDVLGALNTAMTIADGTYSISGGTGPYRVEFVLPNSYYASNGGVSNSTIQFVAAGGTANLGVNYPTDFCQANPNVIVPLMVFGSNTQFPNEPTLVGNPYSKRVFDLTVTPPVPNVNTYAKASDIGSVYGTAYNRQTQTIYAAAFMKRYAGFGPGNTGADGSPGAIYKITTAGAVSVLLDLPASEIGANTHPNTTTDFLKDPTWFEVGKSSWGDIVLSDDFKKLYAMNLFNRNLYEIDANNGAVLNKYPIPGITGGASFSGCSVDQAERDIDLRPFGLKYYQDKIYIGVICTGESRFVAIDQYGGKGDVQEGFVFEFTPGTGFDGSPKLSFPMKEGSNSYTIAPEWRMWVPSSVFGTPANWSDYRTGMSKPIISDIDFLNNGDMVIGIRDLTKDVFAYRDGTFYPDGVTSIAGYQGSGGSHGAVLRACKSGAAFMIENNGSCGGNAGFDTKSYYSQFIEHGYGDLMGGIGVLPAEDMVISNAQPGASTNAVAFIDPTSKQFDAIDQLNVVGAYNFSVASNASAVYSNPLFGKANGMGDIELLCNAAPIEIGNRVFMDTDSDGEQDADEMGLDGIIVELWKAGSRVTDVTTTDGGEWYFGNLDAETDYEVKILGSSFPTGKSLTTSNTVSNAKDLIDNDAALVGLDAVITYKTGTAGQNNHSLDFGFKVGCSLTATAAGTNPKCNAGTDGAASVEPSGNAGPVTYAWSNTQTTQAITGLTAGVYTVTVTESPSCTAVATVTLTQPTALILVCSKTDATTVGGSEGTAKVVASGATAPYTYLWSNGSTSDTQTSLPKGTYIVTVTDANACTSSCSSVVNEPNAPVCDLTDAGLTTYIDQKGTASTADDEYVISANPTGTGLAATYNVTGDITKTSVAYGSVVEIGRVPITTVTVNIIITDAGTSTCSVADGAYNLNGKTCILLANPIVLCNDNGTPTIATDDTYSITINPTGNNLTANYNVSGDLTVSNLAYGSAQQIATGLAISAGGKTINLIDVIKVDCKLLNINIAPPATCSSAIPCPTKLCTPVKVTKL